ncbi:MAG: Lrp/AsnC family transcriptional regulator [Candidatus Verstraetearchaeota archaeon]|nr:Lrp/AsnC family transcriptional regulator [Candidatus Verstraetearchaeota archaeon]
MEEPILTDRQVEILRTLFGMSEQTSVFTIRRKQIELANGLGLTRQALNIHLRKLRDAGLIRTGRGFIDLTESALRILGVGTAEAFVFLKINPPKREQVYEKIRGMPALDVYRVTGEIDLVAVVPQSQLDKFLEEASAIEGVISTSSHVVISSVKHSWKNL